MGTTNPRSPEEMTPEWLTAALRSRGTIKDAAVTSARVEPIGEGAGFLGQLARLHLTYDRSEAGAPVTVIAKLPTLDPGGREVCRLFEFYEREIRFYDRIAPDVTLRVPRAYYTSMDPAADDFLLLLEDLCDVRMVDEVAGCTAQEAEQIIRGIAEQHARWWESPALAEVETWMPAVNAPVQQTAEPAYNQAWEPFLQMFGDAQSQKVRAIGEAMKTKIVAILHELAPAPRTIIHGDWRLDNIFFGSDCVAAIDWQIATIGRGAFDVGYFLSSCIEPEVRRAEEMRLLRLWHEIATAGHSNGYTFDDALIDYRRSVLFCNVYTVVAIGNLAAANDRGLALFHAWLRRRSAAIEELEAGALLPA